jgi:hypothetical protein
MLRRACVGCHSQKTRPWGMALANSGQSRTGKKKGNGQPPSFFGYCTFETLPVALTAKAYAASVGGAHVIPRPPR